MLTLASLFRLLLPTLGLRAFVSTLFVWPFRLFLIVILFTRASFTAEKSPPQDPPLKYSEENLLHVIVPGDTLWELADTYLHNSFLWPQLWDANRYIENPHIIYPGDALKIPELEVLRNVSEDLGSRQETPNTDALLDDPTQQASIAESAEPTPSRNTKATISPLVPAYEEDAINCAGYYLTAPENEEFRIIGSEEGDTKVNLAINDIVYLNQGSDSGLSPGKEFFIQRREPIDWDHSGEMVTRSGVLVVLATQPTTALAQIVTSCAATLVGDYLIPFDQIPVPLVPVGQTAARLTAQTGQMAGKIIASLQKITTLGTGYLVSIDIGETDGVIPGNVFTVFRHVYPNTPRKILGEIAVLTVQPSYATARIMESYDYMVVGDSVELK